VSASFSATATPLSNDCFRTGIGNTNTMYCFYYVCSPFWFNVSLVLIFFSKPQARGFTDTMFFFSSWSGHGSSDIWCAGREVRRHRTASQLPYHGLHSLYGLHSSPCHALCQHLRPTTSLPRKTQETTIIFSHRLILVLRYSHSSPL
jgi:hypothetical protein